MNISRVDQNLVDVSSVVCSEAAQPDPGASAFLLIGARCKTQ